ncbi:DUF4127 family protein [Ruania alba]|uniref:DUF4127 family protein n=1 Tax=Ruania alba TaxID=648782 RepID=A0A1H5MBS1_9MICO|nr:DUF4127 family protein [Ruania alba]SEE86724.1 Protein of unknown function [Ruania alba]
MRIALLPPDERPNTAGYAEWFGRCCGVDVLLPPRHLMPRFREGANTAGLAVWLREIDRDVDAVVLSLDLLVHGGLIPSRNTPDGILDALPRLEVLRGLTSPITAYQVVTRLPHYDNNTRSRQEPEYWATHGRRLFELSQAWDNYEHGETDTDQVSAAREAVPADAVADLVGRRLRNHTINLTALSLLADGTVATLAITSDDTAPRGLPASDRRALDRWNNRLGTHALFYPGADEVPSVLTARVAAEAQGVTPRICVRCPEPGGLDRTAPYEDRPLNDGIGNQIRALGAVRVDDPADADVVLVVYPPSTTPGDWTGEAPEPSTPAEREGLVAEVEALLADDRRVALADVRYANGSDPLLVDALDGANLLQRLVSYGGWNTAGNTLGTTLATAASETIDNSDEACHEREQFRANKIIKDGHYLPVLRPRLLHELRERGLTDPPLEEIPDLERRVEAELNDWASGIGALNGWRVRHVRWPWNYLFTVDFDLERIQ